MRKNIEKRHLPKNPLSIKLPFSIKEKKKFLSHFSFLEIKRFLEIFLFRKRPPFYEKRSFCEKGPFSPKSDLLYIGKHQIFTNKHEIEKMEKMKQRNVFFSTNNMFLFSLIIVFGSIRPDTIFMKVHGNIHYLQRLCNIHFTCSRIKMMNTWNIKRNKFLP